MEKVKAFLPQIGRQTGQKLNVTPPPPPKKVPSLGQKKSYSKWYNQNGQHSNELTCRLTKGETITRVNGNVSFFAGKRLQNF